MKQNDYNIASDACSGNPSDCDKGLSISVWEKPIFGATVFEAMNNSALASKKYVLSTGMWERKGEVRRYGREGQGRRRERRGGEMGEGVKERERGEG